MPTHMRRCRICGNEFPATTEYFSVHTHTPTKFHLRAVCRKCSRKTPLPERLPPGMKRCSLCKQLLPATTEFFYREKKGLYGLYSRCKPCAIKCARDYQRRNPEVLRRAARKKKALHPEKIRAIERRRRAREQGAAGTHTSDDIDAQLKHQKGRCYYCGEKVSNDFHIDHVIPLSRGGTDSPDNLVITCPTCNLRKSSKLPHEWAEGGRLL